MPDFRNVTVHVTNAEGDVLREWGTQKFSRHDKISSYIESKAGVGFRVTVTPSIPFIAPDAPSAHSYETRARGDDRPGRFKMADEWMEDSDGKASTNKWRRSGSGDWTKSSGASGRRVRSGRRRSKNREPTPRPTSFSSPLGPRDYSKKPPPPFHLLASLYLDGRSKPERKMIIYLDPDDEDFNKPDGKMQFKTRWVQGRDGILRELTWVFKDVGIETVFDRMLISGEKEAAERVAIRDEADLISAMNTTTLDTEKTYSRESKVGVGKIVVKFERVRLGEKWTDHDFVAKHHEGEEEDVKMEGAGSEITHTAGFHCQSEMESRSVKVVSYVSYKEGEGPYATFEFFYRSEEQLRKFDFPGFPKRPVNGIWRKSRSENLAAIGNVTPLGIQQHANTLASTGSSKRKVTFEEKVNKKEKFDDAPAPSFGNVFREKGRARTPSPDSPSSDDDNDDSQDETWGKRKRSTRARKSRKKSPNSSTKPGVTNENTPPSTLQKPALADSYSSSINTTDKDSSATQTPPLRRSTRKSHPPRNFPPPEHTESDSSTLTSPPASRKATTTATTLHPKFLTPHNHHLPSTTTSNDGDDEAESDKENSPTTTTTTTHTASASIMERLLDDAEPTTQHQDDKGLHVALAKIDLRKRGRDRGDGDGNDADADADDGKWKLPQRRYAGEGGSHVGVGGGSGEEEDGVDGGDGTVKRVKA